MNRRPPRSPLFPYTTLFRSLRGGPVARGAGRADHGARRVAQRNGVERQVDLAAVAPLVPRLVIEHRFAGEDAAEHGQVPLADFRRGQFPELAAEQLLRLAAVDAARRGRAEVTPAPRGIQRPDQVVRRLHQVAVHRLALAQRALGGIALARVAVGDDHGLLRRLRIRRAPDCPAKERTAVLAAQLEFALEDLAACQQLVALAGLVPQRVGRVEHARGLALQLAWLVAEHLLEAPVAAHDDPVGEKRDPHRQRVEHQLFLRGKLHVGILRALQLAHVGEYADDPPGAAPYPAAVQPATVARLEMAHRAGGAAPALDLLLQPLLLAPGIFRRPHLDRHGVLREHRLGRARQLARMLARAVELRVTLVAHHQAVFGVENRDALREALDRVTHLGFARRQAREARLGLP